MRPAYPGYVPPEILELQQLRQQLAYYQQEQAQKDLFIEQQQQKISDQQQEIQRLDAEKMALASQNQEQERVANELRREVQKYESLDETNLSLMTANQFLETRNQILEVENQHLVDDLFLSKARAAQLEKIIVSDDVSHEAIEQASQDKMQLLMQKNAELERRMSYLKESHAQLTSSLQQEFEMQKQELIAQSDKAMTEQAAKQETQLRREEENFLELKMRSNAKVASIVEYYEAREFEITKQHEAELEILREAREKSQSEILSLMQSVEDLKRSSAAAVAQPAVPIISSSPAPAVQAVKILPQLSEINQRLSFLNNFKFLISCAAADGFIEKKFFIEMFGKFPIEFEAKNRLPKPIDSNAMAKFFLEYYPKIFAQMSQIARPDIKRNLLLNDIQDLVMQFVNLIPGEEKVGELDVFRRKNNIREIVEKGDKSYCDLRSDFSFATWALLKNFKNDKETSYGGYQSLLERYANSQLFTKAIEDFKPLIANKAEFNFDLATLTDFGLELKKEMIELVNSSGKSLPIVCSKFINTGASLQKFLNAAPHNQMLQEQQFEEVWEESVQQSAASASASLTQKSDKKDLAMVQEAIAHIEAKPRQEKLPKLTEQRLQEMLNPNPNPNPKKTRGSKAASSQIESQLT